MVLMFKNTVITKLSLVIRSRLLCSSIKDAFPPLTRVQEVDCEKQQEIQWKELYEKQQPILFKNINKSMPACSKWKDHKYLQKIVSSNDRTIVVPVELGDSYMDESLQILHLDFLELLNFFAMSDSNKKEIPQLYLAQVDINEIPGLTKDLRVPDMAKTGSGSIYRSNIWISGPSGSSSPCHNDPFQNIIYQIYGQKKVILFPQSSQDKLYLNDPHHKQKNTSKIDFRNPDLSKFPLFKSAQSGFIASLEPSDSLFIPYKWFHYCETIDRSCSVNYWWL